MCLLGRMVAARHMHSSFSQQQGPLCLLGMHMHTIGRACKRPGRYGVCAQGHGEPVCEWAWLREHTAYLCKESCITACAGILSRFKG